MKNMVVAAVLGVTLSGLWIRAQAHDGGHDAVQPAAVSLQTIAWMAGHWQGAFSNGVKAEEVWSAPAGGSMMGMFRMMPNDKATLYEFLVIEEDEDGVALRFRHYGRRHKEMDEHPLHLRLVRANADEAVFENATEGGRPRRIVYRIDGEDLVCKVESTRDDGQPESFSVRFSKAEVG